MLAFHSLLTVQVKDFEGLRLARVIIELLVPLFALCGGFYYTGAIDGTRCLAMDIIPWQHHHFFMYTMENNVTFDNTNEITDENTNRAPSKN